MALVIETGSGQASIYAGIALGGNMPEVHQFSFPASPTGKWLTRPAEPAGFTHQSAVMPASLTTFAHSATSALMMSANCFGGALFGSHPAVSRRCCTSDA